MSFSLHLHRFARIQGGKRPMSSQPKTKDPKEAAPKPPFPKQQQEPVGSEAEMQPQPDYGSNPIGAAVNFRAKPRSLPGETAASVAPSRWRLPGKAPTC